MSISLLLFLDTNNFPYPRNMFLNFSTLMIILLLYVEALIFILETLEKLGIYYRIMLVLLLFMHLLVVD